LLNNRLSKGGGKDVEQQSAGYNEEEDPLLQTGFARRLLPSFSFSSSTLMDFPSSLFSSPSSSPEGQSPGWALQTRKRQLIFFAIETLTEIFISTIPVIVIIFPHEDFGWIMLFFCHIFA